MIEEGLNQVPNLVDRSYSNIEAYRDSSNSETRLRVEFVDPFFEALGWDVSNKDVLERQMDTADRSIAA